MTRLLRKLLPVCGTFVIQAWKPYANMGKIQVSDPLGPIDEHIDPEQLPENEAAPCPQERRIAAIGG